MAGYEPLSSVEVEAQALSLSRVRKGGGWLDEYLPVEDLVLVGALTDASSRMREIAASMEAQVNFEYATDGPPLLGVGDKLQILERTYRITYVEDHGMTGKHTTYALVEEAA